MTNPGILYRLIVLQLLNQSAQPLTNTQITSFMLETDYTSYFTVQQTLYDLCSSELIVSESTRGNMIYHITDEGKKTLEFFHDKISDAIKADIDLFLSENGSRLESESTALCDYYKTSDGKYKTHLVIRSNNENLFDLTIDVGTKEQAQALCANWKSQHTEAYFRLMELLLI